MTPLWTFILVLVLDSVWGDALDPVPSVTSEEPPEGYYAFVESPSAVPPRVRPPPYRQIQSECPDLHNLKPHVSSHNLCGDLNRGLIPRNPMGQSPYGEPYPFELIRNQTLKFLSRTLPVLRADDTLPRVAQIQPTAEEALDNFSDNGIGGNSGEREKRSAKMEPSTDDIPSSKLAMEHRALDTPRESRKFCDGGGVFCMLYRAINGENGVASANGPTTTVERREDPGASNQGAPPRYEGPPTPCPARVEYATPVFARNYQGVWRYVVQIPYEGYFTQTIEVTRCMQSRCHYLDGGCLSSPRWASMLVAELHYPDAVLSGPAGSATSRPHSPQAGSATGGPPPVHDFQNYQQYLQKRAGVQAGAGPAGLGAMPSDSSTTDKPPHCDGHDELGCFQVRLYYDWFLVPGSCKCWRPDYFARYVRRKSSGTEL